jgi:hypothetical protein
MNEEPHRQPILYLVEDDDFQAESLCELIGEKFPSIEVKRIATHSGFKKQFEQLAEDQPVCIIIDEMLKWKNDSISEAPRDLNSYLQAGTDCRLQMLSDPRTDRIPALIYSVLDPSDVKLPRDTKFLRKDSHESKLIQWIKGALDGSV